MHNRLWLTSLLLTLCCAIGLGGCSIGGSSTPMDPFSGGTVTFGKLVSNPDRIGEAEPDELSKTIHNQLVVITGKYKVGGVFTESDYDLIFGPYPPASPNVGEIKLVNWLPENVPEVEIISGYAAVGGTCPVVRGPGQRSKTTGTQFATVVKPSGVPGDSTIYVVYINKTGSEKIEVASTATPPPPPPPTESIENVGWFVKATVTGGKVTAIDSEAKVTTDAWVNEFYIWVKDMISAGELRN